MMQDIAPSAFIGATMTTHTASSLFRSGDLQTCMHYIFVELHFDDSLLSTILKRFQSLVWYFVRVYPCSMMKGTASLLRETLAG